MDLTSRKPIISSTSASANLQNNKKTTVEEGIDNEVS